MYLNKSYNLGRYEGESKSADCEKHDPFLILEEQNVQFVHHVLSKLCQSAVDLNKFSLK